MQNEKSFLYLSLFLFVKQKLNPSNGFNAINCCNQDVYKRRYQKWNHQEIVSEDTVYVQL